MSARARLLAVPFGLALLIGCVEPGVAPEKVQALQTGLLASVQDGRTTRQDVLLRFGTPASSFEGGRILSLDFVMDGKGEWRRVGTVLASDWRFNPLPGPCSLVLVFGPDGVLVRHSLVTDGRGPASPAVAGVTEGQDRVK